VAFSPDGTILASAGIERTVALQGVENGKMSRGLTQDDELMAVTSSPDGTRLACEGYDNVVCLWGNSLMERHIAI
jgi:WD40 repeat protein